MAKSTKQEASYQASASSKLCKDCAFFRKGGECSKVIGSISPNGSCDYWQKA